MPGLDRIGLTSGIADPHAKQLGASLNKQAIYGQLANFGKQLLSMSQGKKASYKKFQQEQSLQEQKFGQEKELAGMKAGEFDKKMEYQQQRYDLMMEAQENKYEKMIEYQNKLMDSKDEKNPEVKAKRVAEAAKAKVEVDLAEEKVKKIKAEIANIQSKKDKPSASEETRAANMQSARDSIKVALDEGNLTDLEKQKQTDFTALTQEEIKSSVAKIKDIGNISDDPDLMMKIEAYPTKKELELIPGGGLLSGGADAKKANIKIFRDNIYGLMQAGMRKEEAVNEVIKSWADIKKESEKSVITE